MLTSSAILAVPLRLTFFSYSLFFAGFFFFPGKPEHYEYYYWTVLPFAVILAPTAFKLLKRSPLFWLVFAYTVYMFAASAWSQPLLIDDFLFFSRCILYVLSFVAVTVVLLHEYPDRFEVLIKLTCACAAITAIAGIALWYGEHDFPASRLWSIGKFQAPIETACAFGVFGLLALHYTLREKTTALRIGFGVCMLLIFAFIIFGQSRSGIAAFIAATMALTLTQYPKKGLLLLLLFVAVAAAVWIFLPELTAQLTRGIPQRPAIWASVLTYAKEAPFFGYGSLSDTAVVLPEITHPHAHSPFLASFRDGGIVGLALLLTLLGYACVAAVRHSRSLRNPLYLILWIYLMICITPNADRFFVRPSAPWMYFWLPLIFLIWQETLTRRDGDGVKTSALANS